MRNSWWNICIKKPSDGTGVCSGQVGYRERNGNRLELSADPLSGALTFCFLIVFQIALGLHCFAFYIEQLTLSGHIVHFTVELEMQFSASA